MCQNRKDERLVDENILAVGTQHVHLCKTKGFFSMSSELRASLAVRQSWMVSFLVSGCGLFSHSLLQENVLIFREFKYKAELESAFI